MIELSIVCQNKHENETRICHTFCFMIRGSLQGWNKCGKTYTVHRRFHQNPQNSECKLDQNSSQCLCKPPSFLFQFFSRPKILCLSLKINPKIRQKKGAKNRKKHDAEQCHEGGGGPNKVKVERFYLLRPFQSEKMNEHLIAFVFGKDILDSFIEHWRPHGLFQH